MKTKTIEHSKGEWDVIHVKTEEGFKKRTLEHYFQVVTKEQEHDNHIAQANANLIAAAPDLLAVLTMLYSYTSMEEWDMNTFKIMMSQAKEAIKKATE